MLISLKGLACSSVRTSRVTRRIVFNAVEKAVKNELEASSIGFPLIAFAESPPNTLGLLTILAHNNTLPGGT
jgi:hypothetical protein